MPYTKPNFSDQEVLDAALKAELSEEMPRKERIDLVKKSYQNFYQSAYNNKNTREVMLNTAAGPGYREVAQAFARLMMSIARAETLLLRSGVIEGYELVKGFQRHDLKLVSRNFLMHISAMLQNQEKVRQVDKATDGDVSYAWRQLCVAMAPLDACLADATYPIYSLSKSLCESLYHTDPPSTEEFSEIFTKHRVHSTGGALFLLPEGFALSDGTSTIDYFFMLETYEVKEKSSPMLAWISPAIDTMIVPLCDDLTPESAKTEMPEPFIEGVIGCYKFARNLYTYLATYPGASTEMPLSQVHRSGSGFYTLKNPKPRTTRLLDLPQSSSNRKQSRPSNEDHGGTHASPVTHWRRGHWRNQVCGEKFSERRMKWIEPVLVNPQHKETDLFSSPAS